MELSRRIRQITGGGTGGWDLFFKAQDMKERGEPVIDFTVGDHDIKTHPDILDAMHQAAKSGNTGYSQIPGMPRLRRLIAERFERITGAPTTADQVMVTPGGQSALFAAHHAVLDEGDRALIMDPNYATYPGTIRAVGGVPVTVPALAEHGFQPQASAIAAAAPGAKSLLINSPNNPTGVVYSKSTMQDIAQVVQTHDLWLISDEVYDSQVWDGAHISPRSLPGMADRTLVVGSMSKAYAMTGSRLGWVIGPEDVIDVLCSLATHNTYGVVGYIQAASVFALENWARLEPLVAAPYEARRDMAVRIFSNHPVLHLTPPSGAMYVMLDVRQTGLSGEDFAYALLEATQIAVMPGESFGMSSAGHIRLALTLPEEALEAALHRIAEFALSLETVSSEAAKSSPPRDA